MRHLRERARVFQGLLLFRRRCALATRDGARLLWLKTDLLDDSAESRLFRRFSDGELTEFTESPREVGIVHPPAVCPKGERFEVVSGHHRVRAERLFGWDEVLCIVRDLPDDEAVAQLIDANIRGRGVQAIGNRRGEGADLQLPDIRRTSPQNETKLPQGRTLERVGAEFGISRAQAHRYLKLNDLIPEL